MTRSSQITVVKEDETWLKEHADRLFYSNFLNSDVVKKVQNKKMFDV